MWGDRDKVIQQIIHELKQNPLLTAGQLYNKMSLTLNLKQSTFTVYVSNARQLMKLERDLRDGDKQKQN